MHLKSLILRGFKTFAEKTTFEFQASGIAAIVGPNGCGKSNTVDAFRFALGEGALSEIRVKNLPDVIFAGTKERKPLSMSEVAIILDNSDHKLPIDFNEISIRRRTFRDGASEFLINNNACRLKDIRDLFLDSAISEDSLSIVGQGKVDAILSTQPEDRRAIFEEIAGIKKYKQRKIDAEKKLILAEQNLLRISDLKNEIGEKLGVLEEQAKAAEEYTRLKEELKQCEIGLARKQVGAMLEKSQAIKKEIEEFEKSEEERNRKGKVIDAEKQNLKEKIKENEINLEHAHGKIEEIKERLENERSSIIIEQQRSLFEEKNRLRDLMGEERFLVFEINQANLQLGTLAEKMRDLANKTNTAQIDALEILPELKEAFKLSEKLQKITKDLIKSIHQKDFENHSLGSHVNEMFLKEIKDLEHQKRIQEETLEGKGAELADVRNKIGELTSQIEILEDQQKDLTLNLNKNPEFLRLQEEHAKLQAAITALRKDKEERTSRLEFLESCGEEPEVVSLREIYFKNKLSLAKTEGELNQLGERILSEYNLTLDDLSKTEPAPNNVTISKKYAAELRSKLLELEPVNLLAIQEFKQSQERFSLISQQHEDLTSARENLMRLIHELDAKAREVFLEKMKIISEHFKAIFSELFVGGEAKLELVYKETDDPLLAGIEISTCPSGRKWLPLQALSGGERALTAIAILFSFLKTNPSPICILDEVDAPLDDANIDRFIKYLKEISKSTQIVIVTHNKYTMKAADIIYGITMEEAGVSRVISMKMDKFADETVPT